MDIKSKIKRLKNEIELKSVLLLTLGTLISGLIPLLFEPFLKNNIPVENFGELDLFLKLLPLFTLLFTFKSDIIISQESEENALSTLKQIINQILFVFLFLLIISFFIKNQLLFLVLIGSLFFAISTVLITYLIKVNKIKHVSVQKSVRRFFELITVLIFVSFYAFKNSLIISNIIGLFFSVLYLLSAFNQKELKYLLTITLMKFDFNIFFKMKHVFWSELLNLFGLSFLSFFVYYNYSKIDLGYLELSSKFLSVPQLFVTGVMTILIQNKIGNLVVKNETIKKYVVTTSLFLTIISVITCILYFFYVETIISNLFSNDWILSGNFVLILLPHLFFFIILSPISRVLYGLNASRSLRNWQVFKTSLILFSGFFFFLDLSKYLLIFSCLSSFGYISLFYFLVKEVNLYENKIESLK